MLNGDVTAEILHFALHLNDSKLIAIVESLLTAERERAIEECAKVCEEYTIVQGYYVAKEIRALKGK